MSREGRAWVLGDNIDTDALAPGQYMKGPIEELAAHVLEGVEPDFARQVKPGDVVIAGRNFGVGSSREQAAQALKLLGISAVTAKSFAGIFYRNAINLGLPVFVCPHTERIANGAGLTIDVDKAVLTLTQSGEEIACEPLPDFLLAIIRDGGLVPHLEKRLKAEANSP